MTDKELRKLNRSALLEMLVEQSRENDRLRAQVDELQRLLSDRQLKINQAGSIAEASLQLNQVFEAAQQAAAGQTPERQCHHRGECLRPIGG